MSGAITGIFVGFIVAGLLFISGYATLILPGEQALSLPFAGRISEAFGADDTLRFVRFIAAFLMLVGTMFVIASLAALLNNTITFAPPGAR